MAKREKPTPINREKFLKNLPDPYQIPEQDLQPYDNSNPNAKYRNPGEPEFVRGNEISMDGDTNNTINISLEDHDETILYYLENHIKPTVEINGNQTKVPIIYGSPERWKSMQRDGFFRDKNGKAFIPIIAVKRESFEKDRRLGNKLDGNKVQNVQYFKTGYSKRNSYDNFSILQNQKPSEEYQVGVIPDYITITYKLSIFTDYVEHMNNIIEAIEFASDSYWGDKERFQFRASITSYPTPTEVENGNDRAVKSELTLVVNGYIIPKTINVQKAAPSPKSYNVTKFLFKEFTEDITSPKIDKEGNKIITFTNPGENRVAYYGTFTGNFIGDGSQLTNLPVQDIDTGSFVLTSSFNVFTSSYNTGSFTGSFIGDLIGTASYSDISSFAQTASYVDLGYTPENTTNKNTGSLTNSTSSYPSDYTVSQSLNNKADLVGGKVPASQLPSSVFNVIEGYFNGTDFYTDALFTNLINPESGKIYVDIDTGLTYRWSGSAYVQMGGVGIKGFHRLQSPNFNPAQNTTYYFGGNNLGVAAGARTDSNYTRIFAVSSGVIKKISFHQSAGLGGNTLTARLDNITKGTNLQIANSLLITGINYSNIDDSIGLVVSKNDALTLRVSFSNTGSPTNVNVWCEFLIE